MRPPSVLVALLVELEEPVLPLRSAMVLSTKEEMTDCADSPLVADVVPEECEVLPDRALTRPWNAEVRLEVTLLEAPELPSRLPSNSLLPDSVTRRVSAATVAATFAVELEAFFVDAAAGEVAVVAIFAAEAGLDRLDCADA